ncbi:MAG: hypothetical protein ACRDY0_06485 [Acidimicrobiales bacterium]
MVLAALAARPADPIAATAALDGVAPRLAVIAGGWVRSGLGGAGLADAEADLVAAALAALWAIPPGGGAGPGEVVQRAWHHTHGAWRTERSRVARHVHLDILDADEVADARPGRTVAEELCALVVAALGDGRLSPRSARALWAAGAGWSTAEAASRAGVTAQAWRARRARAVHSLAATITVVA